MSCVVDTNVLIFDTFEDSQHHADAKKMLDAIDKWYLPAMVFHEYSWFMRAEGISLDFTRAKINEYIYHQKTTFLSTVMDDVIFAMTEIADPKDYNDLVILSHAKRLNLALFTYDSTLKKKALRQKVKII